MLKIKQIRENYVMKSGHRAAVIVFADLNRPFDKGDISEDFVWRRKHQKPYKGSEIFNAISEELAKRKIVPIKMRYSKKAGCNMCPCSPGYIVYCEGERYVGPMRTAIWLEEVESENKEKSCN